ncbi:hypothetical protein BDQ12DRAFT_774151 [Crucibulum laeve]|uniref:F-box domain-containing protein n=1 Tax=Crucibulum laeve TaxID=68775 RepID=A0A5C3M638_9AGAR|nr:hypothetical protein BDQ12DRAFT_774151 [Crucibulum laeve]
MPHRLPTVRRPKVSDDVLIAILCRFDPASLYRTCKVFQRVYAIVRSIKALWYKFELAVAGSQDGPLSYAIRSPSARLELLLSYRKNWPTLQWSFENKQQIPDSARAKVSGGFICHSGDQRIDIMELPSCRTGRPPAQTTHLRFQVAPNARIECVAIDPAHVAGGRLGLRLGIRDMRTFTKHPKAVSLLYEFNTGLSEHVTDISAVVSGTKMVLSLKLVGGRAKHLLLEWRTLQATCFDEHDVHLLSDNYILVARKSRSAPKLNLYNITNVAKVVCEREYELPPVWANCALSFGRNTSPTSETSVSPNAIFYSDPSARVLIVTASPDGGSHGASAGNNWLFVNESYFRPPSRWDPRTHIPWSYWSQYSLIRNISASRHIGLPRIVGTRVLYTESEPSRSSRSGRRTRLHIIDFAPYRDAASGPISNAWSLIGQRSPLVPYETYREVPSGTTDSLQVEDVYATEDNIVLIMEPNHGVKPINVLTFGAIRT